MYKRKKKTTVQLTSLLDLLFVMIFVSLLQQKAQDIPEPTKTPIVKKEKVKAPVQKPKPTILSLKAVFNFSSTPSNQNVPPGSFLMAGTYNRKTQAIRLGGISWIQRPKNYDMVPLSGEINAGIGVFKGRIEFQGCKTFTLKRTEKGSKSEISGKYVGIYDCQQGETGLTLEIE